MVFLRKKWLYIKTHFHFALCNVPHSLISKGFKIKCYIAETVVYGHREDHQFLNHFKVFVTVKVMNMPALVVDKLYSTAFTTIKKKLQVISFLGAM